MGVQFLTSALDSKPLVGFIVRVLDAGRGYRLPTVTVYVHGPDDSGDATWP